MSVDAFHSLSASPSVAGRSVHLTGVAGSGMRALAEWLSDQGCRVTGSDAGPSSSALAALQSVGVAVSIGHAAENIPADCDQLIYSAAVPVDNIERVAADARGLRQQSYPQFLGELTRRVEAVCVAGTHGKSTTTALIGSLLSQGPSGASVICGGEVLGRSRAGWAGPAPRLVVESCEFRRHFLQLTPRTLAITGIEWDHVDCFGSLGDTIDAFSQLLRRVPDEGLVIYRADCRASRRALSAARMDRLCTGPRVVSCGVSADADWRVVSRISRIGGNVIELSGPDEETVRLAVPLAGEHNMINAVLAAVTCLELGVPAAVVSDGVQRFVGVRRRLQYIGEWRGMSLWDDYAHHPTAVRSVLTTLREQFPQRRLLVAFQPHQVQRTEVFRDAFADALLLADHSWLLPAYTAREATNEAATASAGLNELLQRSGGRSQLLPSLDRLSATLETEGRPGDVVVLMGAGSIERIADEFSVRLRRNHAG
ncbi:MAG: UDP-N-acetylmuramate--L-alanine ligase [Planctomycetaceae bacterium]